MKILFQKTTILRNPISAGWHAHAYWQMDYSPDIRKIKVFLENKTLSLSPSEFLLIPPYCGHKIIVPSRGVYKNVKFEAENFIAANRRAFTVPLAASENIINEILAKLESDDDISKRVNEKLLDALFISLNLPEKNKRSSGKISDERISAAVNYMEKTSFSELKLDKIASEAKLSLNHFIRKFTEETGITPMRYLKRQRMKKAVELLRYSDFNLSQIADALEFPDLHRFSRAFKNEFGSSPGNYRKKLVKK